MSSIDIPLFPLPVVLFPGGRLPLRIFEPRYLDMVRECSAKDGFFGVCLVNNQEETNRPATHLRVGTTAKITDFSTLDDGLLGIVARGEHRFIIQSTRMRDNGLLMAEVNLLDEAVFVETPDEYSVLSLIAGRMMEHLGENYPSFQPADLQDATWLGYRLSELLPLENAERQSLLQLSDPLQRLQVLLELLPRFQESGES
ncbi:MAG: LON peptidase substrate-binding domain-containing protein [Xanthomonadales bacterium]|nr:LON peptidase substrate-binding domain-containing protein [Xanthomonadales bacterium]